MSSDSKAPTSIKRSIGNSSPTDVGRGIIRLTKSDAALLAVGFGDLLEIKSQSECSAYAKCCFIHPDDENSFAGKVQIDNITLSSIGMGPQRSSGFAMVELVKSHNQGFANSVSIAPVTDERGMPPDIQKIDTRWISTMLEDKPLWKGALIAVPAEGKMSLFRIVAVDPPVAIGTMITRVELAGEDRTESPQTTSSKLFGFSLSLRFKGQAPDYDTLATSLSKKGFTKPETRRAVGMVMMARGMDPDLMRIPQLKETEGQPPPPLRRGRIQIHGMPPAIAKSSLMIGHCYNENPFEKPDELLRDIEVGFPLIQETLEKDLNIDFHTDVEAIILEAFYRVATGKDSRPLLDSITDLPNVPELAQLIGRKEEDRKILLYPGSRPQDRSLTPIGLMELVIHAMNVVNMRSDYDVSFKYRLVDFPSAVRLINSSTAKAASIVNALEKAR